MSELLKLEAVNAGYGKKQVLHEVGFTLKEGEICALLGLNGSGKSTLLKAVCGLVPAKGSILLQGRQVAGLSAKEKACRVSYLPQKSSASLALCAMQVVLMGFNPVLHPLQSYGKQHQKEALRALRRVGLEALAGEDFCRLSGGQQQLVLLARALVRSTALLALDEPDSALDFCNRHKLMSIVTKQAHEGKSGVLVCTHDANFALQYAHRLLLLKEGRLLHSIEPAQAPRQRLEAALQQIYGPIQLVMHQGHYFMIKGENGSAGET